MVSVASAILLVFFTGCEPPSDETTPKRIAEDTCQHNALSEETQPLIVSVVDPIDGRVLIPAVDTTSFTDAVRQLPFIFWLLCVEVMLIYGIIVPFNIVANEYLQAKWFAGDPERAGQVMRYVGRNEDKHMSRVSQLSQ